MRQPLCRCIPRRAACLIYLGQGTSRVVRSTLPTRYLAMAPSTFSGCPGLSRIWNATGSIRVRRGSFGGWLPFPVCFASISEEPASPIGSQFRRSRSAWMTSGLYWMPLAQVVPRLSASRKVALCLSCTPRRTLSERLLSYSMARTRGGRGLLTIRSASRRRECKAFWRH